MSSGFVNHFISYIVLCQEKFHLDEWFQMFYSTYEVIMLPTEAFNEKILAFHLPRFAEIPDIDLYMDQLLFYIERVFQPLEGGSKEKILTTAMVNNYVKQKLIAPPVRKRYSREHIAYLIVISVFKNLFSIQEIHHLLQIQISSFPIGQAYDYFCRELENILQGTFSQEGLPDDTSVTNAPQSRLVRCSMIAFAHKLYTLALMDELAPPTEKAKHPLHFS